MKQQVFEIKGEVSKDQVAGLLCTAFEGGVGYWCQVTKKTAPKVPAKLGQDWNDYPLYSYPLAEGGSVTVKDIETGKLYTLNLESIQKGLEVMSAKAPKHFADFITENDDATTGDVFLQCCLLGDIVYG